MVRGDGKVVRILPSRKILPRVVGRVLVDQQVTVLHPFPNGAYACRKAQVATLEPPGVFRI